MLTRGGSKIPVRYSDAMRTRDRVLSKYKRSSPSKKQDSPSKIPVRNKKRNGTPIIDLRQLEIEQNADDRQSKCGKCIKTFKRKCRSIWCDKCKSWFHISCVGISKERFDELANSQQPWFCSDCSKDTASTEADRPYGIITQTIADLHLAQSPRSCRQDTTNDRSHVPSILSQAITERVHYSAFVRIFKFLLELLSRVKTCTNRCIS